MGKYSYILYLDNWETIYTKAICKELHKMGEKVDCFFYDGIYKSPAFLGKYNKKKELYLREKNYNDFLEYIKHNNYDIMLIKAPMFMPKNFFEKLYYNFKDIPKINYNWSSVKKFNFLSYIDFFSKVYSFDPIDCKKYNLNYFPLFYLKEFEKIGFLRKKKYEMSFIGKAFNPGRLKFFDSLIKNKSFKELNKFIYLYTPGKLRTLKAILKYPQLARFFYLSELSLNEVLNVFSFSESMIDQPMSIQSGLTIRTFETLGAGLTLYTTNKEILKEPFYDKGKIVVLNNADDFQFSRTTNNANDAWYDEFRKYRIDNWLRYILRI